MESLLLFCYCLVFFFYLTRFIANDTLLPVFGESMNVAIEPDRFTTMLAITITCMPLLHYYNGNNSPQFIYCYALLGAVFIVVIFKEINVASLNIEYCKALVSTTLCCILVYKQFALLQKVNEHHLWFDDNYKENTDICFISCIYCIDIKYMKHMKWILYILCNLCTYGYCFIYLAECNNLEHHVIIEKMLMILMPISLCLLPPHIKYDLFHYKKQMRSIIMCQLVSHLWTLLWSVFNLKYYIFDEIHVLFLGLCVIGTIISGTVLPLLWAKYKQFKLRHKLCNAFWWQYALRNNNNLRNFYLYLAHSKTTQHLLFIIEIMQYKNCIINKLKIAVGDCGYLLPMNGDNNQTFVASSPIVNDIVGTEIELIDIQRINNDLVLLHNKYIARYNDDGSDNALFLSFVSLRTKELSLKKLNSTNINDTQIIHIFDEAMQETEHILQLLYIEYQLDS